MDSQQSTPSAPTAPPPEAFPEAGTSAEALIAAAEAARQPSVPGRGALGVHEPFVRSFVRSTCDWPRRGITFLDISPLLAETRAFRTCVDALVERYVDSDITHVAGVDARGFTIGTALAYALNCGFIMVRKAGKLPPGTDDEGTAILSEAYEMEYGHDRLQMASDLFDTTPVTSPRVVLVDDLLASGGTAVAACNLLRVAGATVVEVAVVIELVTQALGGRSRLKEQGAIELHSLLTF